MKKLISLFFTLLFFTRMINPAFAADYRKTTMDYLTKEYGVAEDKIELYEGGIIELEFTAESFWVSGYTIFPKGKPASGDFKGGGSSSVTEPMPLPAPEIMPMPAPDIPADDAAAILPAYPGDAAEEGNIYGSVYISIKTGEVLEQDKMEEYFIKESRLAEQEWERLRKEAGKLDVSLYQKLQKSAAGEKYTVSIHPTFVETDEVRAQFEALKEKYPEYTSGMDLKGIFPYVQAYDMPYIRGEGVSSSSGATDSITSDMDAAVSHIVPEDGNKSTPALEEGDVKILPVAPDEKFRQEYSAMWEELEQIRLQALAPSLAAIKEELDGMGIDYEDNRSYITADLTKEQIGVIADSQAVAQIYEEALFVALDARESMLAAGSAPNTVMTAYEKSDKDASSSSYLLPVALIAVLMTGAFMIYFRRASKNN